MAESAASLNASSRCRSAAQCRRATENKTIYELARLLPVSTHMKQDKLTVLRLTLAYIKFRDGLDADDNDVLDGKYVTDNLMLKDECPSPASVNLKDQWAEPELPPMAVIDTDGNVIAGKLDNTKPKKEPIKIQLSDNVLNKLHEEFLTGRQSREDAENSDSQMEKLVKYKEGLERGMQEFLCQSVSENPSSNNTSSSDRKRKYSETIPESDPFEDESDPAEIEPANDEQIIHHSVSLGAVQTKKHQTHAFPQQLPSESSILLDAAPAFFISLDRNMTVLYVSENVSEFLGFSQCFLIGQDIAEFICEKDFQELERQMDETQFDEDAGKWSNTWQTRRTFYMAMKFAFQKPNSRSKDTGFALYQWNARLRLARAKDTGKICIRNLISLCRPVCTDTVLAFETNGSSFLTKYSMGMKVMYCDPKVQELTGYTPEELIGLSAYTFTHPGDLQMCEYSHQRVLKEGKDSRYCRAISRNGGWMWTYSQITVSYDRNGKPQCISTRSFLVSKEEAERALSSEREKYERMKCFDFKLEWNTHNNSQRTLASIAADAELKAKRCTVNGESNVGPSKRRKTVASRRPSSVSTESLNSLSPKKSPKDKSSVTLREKRFSKSDLKSPQCTTTCQSHTSQEGVHSENNKKCQLSTKKCKSEKENNTPEDNHLALSESTEEDVRSYSTAPTTMDQLNIPSAQEDKLSSCFRHTDLSVTAVQPTAITVPSPGSQSSGAQSTPQSGEILYDTSPLSTEFLPSLSCCSASDEISFPSLLEGNTPPSSNPESSPDTETRRCCQISDNSTCTSNASVSFNQAVDDLGSQLPSSVSTFPHTDLCESFTEKLDPYSGNSANTELTPLSDSDFMNTFPCELGTPAVVNTLTPSTDSLGLPLAQSSFKTPSLLFSQECIEKAQTFSQENFGMPSKCDASMFGSCTESSGRESRSTLLHKLLSEPSPKLRRSCYYSCSSDSPSDISSHEKPTSPNISDDKITLESRNLPSISCTTNNNFDPSAFYQSGSCVYERPEMYGFQVPYDTLIHKEAGRPKDHTGVASGFNFMNSGTGTSKTSAHCPETFLSGLGEVNPPAHCVTYSGSSASSQASCRVTNGRFNIVPEFLPNARKLPDDLADLELDSSILRDLSQNLLMYL